MKENFYFLHKMKQFERRQKRLFVLVTAQTVTILIMVIYLLSQQ